MKKLASIFLVVLSLGAALGNALAQPDSRLLNYVSQAVDDERDPGEVTQSLLDQGFEPARAAQAVAQGYGSCGASQAAVAVAATQRPLSTTDVVTAVGSVDGCACGATSGWARSQLDQRIRFSSPQRPIELVETCTCMTAAVEAGVAAQPQLADAIVLAALETLQAQTLARDVIGERGGADNDNWLPNPDFTGRQVFRRRDDVCQADTDENDRFDPLTQWQPGTAEGELPLGRCAGEDDEDDASGLMIREFAADGSGAGHVWLVNHSDAPINLGSDDYRIGVAYRDLEKTAANIPLVGIVQPGTGFLLASRTSPLAGQADQVVPALSLAPGDFFNLHQPLATPACECAEALTAAAFRGSRNRVAGTGEQSPAEHKMQRLLGGHPFLKGFVVDSVGRVSDAPEPLLFSEDPNQALGRRPSWCERDGFELDGFSDERWQSIATLSDARDCAIAEAELVIADLLVTESGYDALRLLNASKAPVDLGGSEYYLEIYGPDEIRPRAEIALDGVVAPGSTFVVAHDDINEALRERSNDLDGALTLADSSAVVLSRRTYRRPISCETELAAFVQSPVDIPLFFIEVTPIEGRDPLAEPPRVDPLASPN
ncbi:MAG: hypothetical protein AAGA23_10490 [Pseudomonadota bacterium]